MKLSDNCSLCTLIESPSDRVIAQDTLTVAVLHDDWAVKGHAMLVWRHHLENLSQLYEEDSVHFIKSYCRLERILLQTLGCDRAIVLKLGLLVPHLHVHVYPISRNESRDGVMAMIEGRARHEPAQGEEGALLATLRLALSETSDARPPAGTQIGYV